MFTIVLLSALSAIAPAQVPTCQAAYGKVACGFDCTAAYGDVRCALTPFGRCDAAYGRVRCSDPPRHVTQRREPVPQMSCLAAYGDVACGYGCVSGYGQVRCAQTPEGVCDAAYGRVECSDGFQQRRHRRGRSGGR